MYCHCNTSDHSTAVYLSSHRHPQLASHLVIITRTGLAPNRSWPPEVLNFCPPPENRPALPHPLHDLHPARISPASSSSSIRSDLEGRYSTINFSITSSHPLPPCQPPPPQHRRIVPAQHRPRRSRLRPRRNTSVSSAIEPSVGANIEVDTRDRVS